MSDATVPDDSGERIRIGGKIFESAKNPLSEEEVEQYRAMFAEHRRRRNAVPPEERFYLSDRYGGNDFDGTEYEEWVNARRAERAAQEAADNDKGGGSRG